MAIPHKERLATLCGIAIWIFEHNFVAGKAKMRRQAVGRNPS